MTTSMNAKSFSYLTEKIEEWAIARKLDTADPTKQMLKLAEEFGELAEGMAKGKTDIVKDSLGDMYVVMTILAMQMDVDFRECIEMAYKEIKDRKGEMKNGVFVKESDL